jgi:hypothetical protein
LKPPHHHTDALIALALDLLAQAEAHHRATTRLEMATRALADGRERRGTYDDGHVRQVREHVIALEQLAATHRNLLSEFGRELEKVLGRANGA